MGRYSWLEILTMVLLVVTFLVTTVLIELGFHVQMMGNPRPILMA